MADNAPPNPHRDYDERFTATPDPWAALARLEHGGDRTPASTVHTMVLRADPAEHAAMERRLLAVLGQVDVTEAAQMFVCRMLMLIGSTAAIPVLVPLLREARTADIARYALDAIDDRTVDEAYRAALGVLEGPSKAGLIGSIALRGDMGAVAAIRVIAANAAEPSDVRAVAGRALERLTMDERSSAQ